ncbi:MAG: rhamnan synthesis F family protein [Hasllibacter sp.]
MRVLYLRSDPGGALAAASLEGWRALGAEVRVADGTGRPDPFAALAAALREAPGQDLLLTGDHAVGPLAPPPRPPAGGFSATAWRRRGRDVHPIPDALWIDGALASRLAGLGPRAIRRALSRAPAAYALAPGAARADDPAATEADALLAADPAAVPAALILGEPIVHDAAAIRPDEVLDHVRARAPALADALVADLLRTRPPREAQLALGDVAVLPVDGPADAPDPGPVAAFLHVYWTDQLPAMLAAADRIPVPFDLFVSTGSEDAAAAVRAALGARPATVRAMAENRGRDMAALFVTFADILRQGRHSVALRLHSKRSPQETAQVAGRYAAHLEENLAATPAYVAAILARFAAEPSLGLAIPPAPHSGLAMLGHGWLNNRAPLAALAAELGIEAPLDARTPLAPWGGMYWFRPAALAPLAARAWRHADYAAEPHYRDGDLAHVQERLIPYAVQSAGCRVLTVMTPRTAARSHARLEMKVDALAGRLASGDLRDQVAQLDRIGRGPRMRSYRALAGLYGAWTRRYPGARPALRRIAHPLRRWLGGGLGRR